ncbi:YbdK family carboxylate-amine ligase [Leucobacter sp. CSA1]|uniref:Putative glutamate--cysteine ligase 2 n=1 Tax=Leucobacter chromiisoli TaxID=2796471 RepID=A0A934Q8J3_9MICO|nr:YbdK family carboxylate-amine ligase [Leucobacter chromiisoli]MBK0420209.1 YbdK family carboxylate-amine ligase [Leucobacter chromiisoli]
MVTRSRAGRRFGVEEEYLLLDAETGLPRDGAEELAASLPDRGVEFEFFQSQLETATPVCSTAEEAERFLTAFRGEVSEAAERLGLVLAGTGLPPIGGDVRGTVTRKPRYEAIAAEMGSMVSRYYSTGTHVHVEVPSRDVGVEVMARLARWSPTLVALMANSPVSLGEDTGFESWRYTTLLHWPTAGYPPGFADGADYERMVQDLVRSGVLLDPALVNWSIRLSEQYPTVELRTADAQLEPRDAVAFAAIVRAIVEQCVADAEAGEPRPGIRPHTLQAGHWVAAKHGLGDELVDPLSGERRPAFELVEELLAHVAEALEAAGDLPRIERFLERRRREGAPAAIQRRHWEERGIPGLVELYAQGSAGGARGEGGA